MLASVFVKELKHLNFFLGEMSLITLNQSNFNSTAMNIVNWKVTTVCEKTNEQINGWRTDPDICSPS